MTVYCGQCNTANRDGSLYCNRCGQRLADSPSRLCPRCEAANPGQGEVCIQCGAALLPIKAGDGSPLPGEWLAEEEEEPLEADVVSLADLAPDSTRAASLEESTHPGSRPAELPPADRLADADELLQRLEAGLGPGPAAPVVGALPGTAQDVGLPAGLSEGGPRSPGQVFADVVASRKAIPVAPVGTEGRGASLASRIIPRLLYLCLLAAVMMPFLVPGEWSGSTIPLSSSTAEFFQTIAALRPGSPVLVAFDYDPATQAEMDSQARAVLAHLMQRGARIVAVSLGPTGPAQAQLAFAVTATAQGYRYGEDYINLGYLAGGEAALATANQDFVAAFPQDYVDREAATSKQVMQGVRGVRDFVMIVVLGADERSVVSWLTQVQARSGVKMVAGTSAASAAQLQPYLASGQLSGLLTGLSGAAEYELLMNHPGPAVRMLDAQSLAHVVIVAFVLLGNLGAAIWGLRGRPAAATPQV